MTSPKLFNFVDQEMIEPGGLEEKLKAMQDELFTGIAMFATATNEINLALYTRGQLVTLYGATGVSLQRIYPRTWLEGVRELKGAITTRALNLNVQDLRVLKIILESAINGRSINPSEVPSTIKKERPTPSVVTLESDNAQTFLFFPGMGRECSYTLFLSAEKFMRSDGWGQPEADLGITWMSTTEIGSSEQSLAWDEMLLHQLFTEWLLKLFDLYDNLKGRLFLNQIIKAINFKATANDWMLSVNAKNVNSQILFNSPEESVKIYSELLSVVAAQFITDIGDPIYRGVFQEFTKGLSGRQTDLFLKLTAKIT